MAQQGQPLAVFAEIVVEFNDGKPTETHTMAAFLQQGPYLQVLEKGGDQNTFLYPYERVERVRATPARIEAVDS